MEKDLKQKVRPVVKPNRKNTYVCVSLYVLALLLVAVLYTASLQSLILNFSVGLCHMQQCDNVCFVHFCRCTNQRDELNIHPQTSTLHFCVSVPSCRCHYLYNTEELHVEHLY